MNYKLFFFSVQSIQSVNIFFGDINAVLCQHLLEIIDCNRILLFLSFIFLENLHYIDIVGRGVGFDGEENVAAHHLPDYMVELSLEEGVEVDLFPTEPGLAGVFHFCSVTVFHVNSFFFSQAPFYEFLHLLGYFLLLQFLLYFVHVHHV